MTSILFRIPIVRHIVPALLFSLLFGSALPSAAAGASEENRPAVPLRMIVVRTQQEARDIAAAFAAGASFEKMAQERSIGLEPERGGYLGRVNPAGLSPEARAAMAKTRPGRLTPVFPTEGGFAVIQVLTDREAQEIEARFRQEADALELLKEGTDLARRGRLEEAVALLQRAVRLSPESVDGHFNLGVALWKLGRVAAAIAAMQEVIRLEPRDFDARIRLGDWLVGQGRHAEAVAHFEQAAAVDMESQETWLKLAQAYEGAGRARAAVGAYRRALGLLGQDDPALLEALLRTAKQTQDGPTAKEAALRLRPFRAGHESFIVVGDALLLNGEFEAAAREYRMAVALSPSSVQALLGLATAHVRLGQPEQAAQHLLVVVRLEPSNAEHFQMLSRLYEGMGRLDLAIVALRDGAAAAQWAPREIRIQIAEHLASLYDRMDMRREAEQERLRAQALRTPTGR
jgi:tetratricopeptide (TPR) repeat protein